MKTPFTPQDVVKAYEKIGMKPRRTTFYDGECCCALSALAMARGMTIKEIADIAGTSSAPIDFLQLLGLETESEMWAFIYGFDNPTVRHRIVDENAHLFQLGKETAKAVFGE